MFQRLSGPVRAECGEPWGGSAGADYPGVHSPGRAFVFPAWCSGCREGQVPCEYFSLGLCIPVPVTSSVWSPGALIATLGHRVHPATGKGNVHCPFSFRPEVTWITSPISLSPEGHMPHQISETYCILAEQVDLEYLCMGSMATTDSLSAGE